MNLVIDVPQSVGERIEQEARKAGVTPAEIAAQTLVKTFSPPPFDVEEQKRQNTTSIALLEQWLQEGKAATPEEAREAEEGLKQFMRNLNEPRKQAGARLLFPEVEEDAEGAA